MNMADILMTLEEVAACVRARTPGEAKGWLKRAGVSPVPFGGKLGTRYMRQDVLEAIEYTFTQASPLEQKSNIRTVKA